MIASGVKTEEYRNISKYYAIRFGKIFKDTEEIAPITFRNGYSKRNKFLTCLCSLNVGIGKEEWGAEKDKEYFILTIHKIVKQYP